MKPEVVEYMFDCYSKGKYRSAYDAVDGVSYTPRHVLGGRMAGEAVFGLDVQIDELIHRYNLVPEACPHRGQLDPEATEQLRRTARQLSEMSDEYENPANRRLSIPDGIPAVQFGKRGTYCKSTDDFVAITIVRSGNVALEQSVAWSTRDNTALAGVHYAAAEGNVLFQPGETQKVIQVQLLAGHEDNNINFKVDLDMRSVNIGPIKTQTVNIIDYDDLSGIVKRTIRHIIDAPPTIPEVIEALREKTTVETFKAALLVLWSNTDSLAWEMRIAFDLLKFTLPYVPYDHLMPFVTQYFANAPESLEIDVAIEGSGSDMLEDSCATDKNSGTSEEDSDLD